MRLFELLASDFWGKYPEKLTHELNEEILEVFKRVILETIEETASSLRDGYNARFLVTRAHVKGREILCKMQVSSHQQSIVFTFRSARPKGDNMGIFYAYAMCAVADSFGGYASCVMGNDMGEYLCEVALKPASAKALILHLQLQSQKAWIENG